METYKGLLVSVIGSDCTNGGITSGKSEVILLMHDAPIFESSSEHPALALICDPPQGARAGYLMVHKKTGEIFRVRAVPLIDGERVPGMFGGNFITDSDSRFPFYCPIPVFDRFETAEEQRMYSR